MKDETRRTADVYVTKWWGTKGLLLVRGAEVTEYTREGSGTQHRVAIWGERRVAAHDGDFYFTYDEACEHVVALAKCKLAAIDRQARKVVSLERAARAGSLAVHEVDGKGE